jgi:chaperonin GroEL (HSP60 family)
MTIQHLFNPELQQKIIKGISKLNDLVSLSIGPKGQT